MNKKKDHHKVPGVLSEQELKEYEAGLKKLWAGKGFASANAFYETGRALVMGIPTLGAYKGDATWMQACLTPHLSITTCRLNCSASRLAYWDKRWSDAIETGEITDSHARAAATFLLGRDDKNLSLAVLNVAKEVQNLTTFQAWVSRERRALEGLRSFIAPPEDLGSMFRASMDARIEDDLETIREGLKRQWNRDITNRYLLAILVEQFIAMQSPKAKTR